MNGCQQYQKLKLTCLSPVHIGSGNVLNKTQYIYDYKANRAYFLRESAWIQYLSARGLLKRLVMDFDNHNVRDLYSWCLAHNIQFQDFIQVSAGWAHVPRQADRDKRYLNNVALLARGADGRPYIPGSSVKGALRTAMLSVMLKKCPQEQRQRYWRQFCALISSRPSNEKLKEEALKITGALEDDLFHRLVIKDADGKTVDLHNAMTSVMKGLSISDAFAVRDAPTCLVRKVDWHNADAGRNPERYLPLARECFAPGTVLVFTAAIQPAIMGTVGFHAITDVLQAAQEYTKTVLDMEKDVFGSRLPGLFEWYTNANLILGGGAGLLSKTLLYSLAPRDEAHKMVAAMLDIEFSQHGVPQHHHSALDVKLSPRTLKLGNYQNTRHHIGMCKLESVKA